jgi:hypothetical protein
MAHHFVLEYGFISRSTAKQNSHPILVVCLVWYNHTEVHSIHISFKKVLGSNLVPNICIPDFWASFFLSLHSWTPGWTELPPTEPFPLVSAPFRDQYSLVRPNVQVLWDLTPCLPLTSYRRFRRTVVLASFRNVGNYLLVDTEITFQETDTSRNTSQRTSGVVVQQQLQSQFVCVVTEQLTSTFCFRHRRNIVTAMKQNDSI